MNFKKAHIIGIGGISMSAIAEYLISCGIEVTGSDRQKSEMTEKLEKLGAKICYPHQKEIITDQDIAIRTAAVADDNEEVIALKEKGILLLERAEFLGELMTHYKNVICVSGTHGKTSTTSMLSYITIKNDLDPTIMVGSNLDIIGGNFKGGLNDYFVAEACEYKNSFLSFAPTISVITNIEADHLDFFIDLDDVISSFRKHCELLPQTGHIIYNFDDENSRKCVEIIDRKKVSYGFSLEADIHPKNIQNNHEYYSFDVYYKEEKLTKVTLSVPGKHNVYNALASLATAYALKLDMDKTADALACFNGSERRFQKIGEINGALVVDDYAHHPTEIETTLNTAKNMGFNRVICIFQSHTYTRTVALFDDFVRTLSLCDHFVSAEIYSAREINHTGISGKDISDKIDGAVFFETFEEIEEYIRKIAKKGDLILTMGAGELNRVAQNLCK